MNKVFHIEHALDACQLGSDPEYGANEDLLVKNNLLLYKLACALTFCLKHGYEVQKLISCVFQNYGQNGFWHI